MLIETGKILNSKCHSSSIFRKLKITSFSFLLSWYNSSDGSWLEMESHSCHCVLIDRSLPGMRIWSRYSGFITHTLLVWSSQDALQVTHGPCMWTSCISYLKLFLTASSFLIKIIFGIIGIIQFDKHSSTSPATCLKCEMMISLYKCIFSQSIKPQ